MVDCLTPSPPKGGIFIFLPPIVNLGYHPILDCSRPEACDGLMNFFLKGIDKLNLINYI